MLDWLSIKNTGGPTAMRAAVLVSALWLGAAAQALAAEAPQFQGRGLDVIAPLLGKTWVGEDVDASGRRTVSVERWDWILDGAAARLTASVSDGLRYQLTFYVDPISHALCFHAVSNAGPYMTGIVSVAEGHMVWDERIVGSPDVDEVKLTFSRFAGGDMVSRSEYFLNGKRLPGGHGFHYHLDPSAEQSKGL